MPNILPCSKSTLEVKRFKRLTSRPVSLLPNLPHGLPIPIDSVLHRSTTLITTPLPLHLQNRLQQTPQSLHRLLTDLIMHHQPSPQQPQALLLPQFYELRVRDATFIKIEPHHIRLRRLRQPPAHGSPHRRYPLRDLMAPLQQAPLTIRAPPKRLIDSHARRGRQHARLPQPPADGFPHPARPPDERLAADQDAAHGRAEALREAQRDGVEAGREVRQRARARDDGLPDPRAVEVQLHAVLAREGADAPRLGEGHDGAAEGVFEGDDARGARVDVVREDDVLLDVLQGQVDAVPGGDAADQRAAQGGDAAGFPFEDVGAVVAEDGVGGLGQVRAQGELVAHGAGEDEERGVVGGELGEVGFEGEGGGVFHEDVVEEGGVLDGA
jgi:hypothetical protein